MKRALKVLIALVMTAGIAASYARSDGQTPSDAVARHFPSNVQQFDEMFRQVSNWGRWGKTDEVGAANLVTAEKRKAAARLVKSGVSVSLARAPITEIAADAPAPFEFTPMPPSYIADTIKVSYHGYTHSHIDAVCHFSYNSKTYNGYPSADVNTNVGCTKLGIHHLKDGIVTRGVLIDIPRLKGLQYLEPSTPIYPKDVEAWEKRAGIKVMPGDALFLRTGRWARRERLGPWKIMGAAAGLHASVVPLLRARDIAFFGSDAVGDVEPTYLDGYAGLGPVHTAVIAAMGVNILDNQYLEALADMAAKLGRWEFMATFSPIPVTGGTGSPINVMATF
jgi:kynurenine formamidase